jgi:hypothetical protein
MLQSLDLKLRAYWAFYDSHGTRLIGAFAGLFSLASAVGVAIFDADSKVAAALLAVNAALGKVVHTRGQTNAAAPPPPPAAPLG